MQSNTFNNEGLKADTGVSFVSATVTSYHWVPPSFAFCPLVVIQKLRSQGAWESQVAVCEIADTIKF